jgi:hypothetical protein
MNRLSADRVVLGCSSRGAPSEVAIAAAVLIPTAHAAMVSVLSILAKRVSIDARRLS